VFQMHSQVDYDVCPSPFFRGSKSKLDVHDIEMQIRSCYMNGFVCSMLPTWHDAWDGTHMARVIEHIYVIYIHTHIQYIYIYIYNTHM
jgi:hypothetical protein